MVKSLVFAAASLLAVAPASAVVVTYGAIPANVAGITVETFNGRTASNSTQTFTDTIGGVGFTYTGVNVGDYGFGNGTLYAGAYSGVGIASSGSYTLDLSQSRNYFGLQITAADATNLLTFFNGSTPLFTYTVGNNIPSQGSSFVNFDFGPQSYTRVFFAAGDGTGFESDNHTIGAVVPEPASWAMTIAGFAALGFIARRNRKITLA